MFRIVVSSTVRLPFLFPQNRAGIASLQSSIDRTSIDRSGSCWRGTKRSDLSMSLTARRSSALTSMRRLNNTSKYQSGLGGLHSDDPGLMSIAVRHAGFPSVPPSKCPAYLYVVHHPYHHEGNTPPDPPHQHVSHAMKNATTVDDPLLCQISWIKPYPYGQGMQRPSILEQHPKKRIDENESYERHTDAADCLYPRNHGGHSLGSTDLDNPVPMVGSQST